MIRTTEKMLKRSWEPYLMKDKGKWATGYAHSFFCDKAKPDQYHEVRQLTITPNEMSYKGHIKFKDTDGDTYLMTGDAALKLIKEFIGGKTAIDPTGKFLVADFVQVKKGNSVFIEVFTTPTEIIQF